MDDFKVLRTQKGKEKLYVDGYTFYLKKSDEDKNIKKWECSYRSHSKEYPRKSCTVKAITDFNITKLEKEPEYHYHSFDCLAVEKSYFDIKLREGGHDNLANSGIIINDLLSEFDPEMHGYLPSKAACYAKIRRARAKAGHHVKEITSIEEMKEGYTCTKGSRPRKFLQTIVRTDDAHALIFATAEALESLYESKIWYADGIYKVTDKPYLQIYVIHGTLKGDSENKVKPLLYTIMSHKRMDLYNKIFNFIKSYGTENQLELKTKFVMIDYEIAVKTAIETEFDQQIKVFGCSFHLEMNLRDRGLQFDKKMFSISKNQLDFHKILALIYLPSERLNIVLPVLKDYLENQESPLLQLLLWFEDTYINEGSRFEGWWNAYTLIENLLPTNNNFAEAFFSSFRKLLDGVQNSLYSVIEKIRKIQITVDGEMLNINEGLVQSKGTYLRRVKQIKGVLEEYKHNDIMLLQKLGKTCPSLKNTGDFPSRSCGPLGETAARPIHVEESVREAGPSSERSRPVSSNDSMSTDSEGESVETLSAEEQEPNTLQNEHTYSTRTKRRAAVVQKEVTPKRKRGRPPKKP